jgi:pimeloyl-ACP methyl ester carboxylesterase/class 3 adenylate cyclase
VEAPQVRYARSGDTSIAYATVGDGPFDVVFVSGWLPSAFEVAWDGPPAEFFERMASFCRLILFDKRGTGLSDRDVGIPDLETRMDDVRVVMDAVGSPRAAIMGVSEGGPMAALFAATYPARTAAAVLYGTGASFIQTDDYPWAPTEEQRDRGIEELRTRWGMQEYFDEMLDWFAPSRRDDESLQRWWRRWILTSAGPSAAVALSQMNRGIDVRHVLPTISVPTLVLHVEHDRDWTVDEGRYLAEHIPGAELVFLPGADHGWCFHTDTVCPEVERFLTGIWTRGEWDQVETERVLATVLFTDIVGATAKAAELGDRGWRDLLAEHHRRVRRQLARFQGIEIDTAGDGFFARFDGPARAIRCAREISSSVRELGIEVRAGVHSGECELVDGKVGGIAVHIGARVAAEAKSGEVLVSQTVKDLVAGSGISFAERGVTELRGVPGEWRVYAVAETAPVA